MKVLESTRSINDACEVKRQLLQQQAPLRFRTTISPQTLSNGAPIDSTIKVYAERPIIERFAKLTRDKARVNLDVGGLGIPTLPSLTTGPLLLNDDVDSLSGIRPHPESIRGKCGRFLIQGRVEAVAPTKAMFYAPNLPNFPSSTRADQRSYWSGCQDNFVKELKMTEPQMFASMPKQM
jgi:hypothetical protein